jgi:hypothetical protein
LHGIKKDEKTVGQKTRNVVYWVQLRGGDPETKTTNQTKKMNIRNIHAVIDEIESTIENGDFTRAQIEAVRLSLSNARIYADYEKIHSVIYMLTSALLHTVGVFHPLYNRASNLAK